MPEVVNDGTRIQFDAVGAGPPLVLLHGWGCDRTWWQHAGFVERLAPHFRLLIIDWRGHGESDKPHDPAAYVADLVISDILAVADAEGADRFAIWGLSYGGWFGWMTADAHPSRVAALVSSGSADPGPDTEESWREFDQTLLEALRRNGVHGLIDLYKEEDGERYVVEYPPWAEEATLRADPEALVACQALELMGRTISVALEEFPVPVMLTTGELEDPEDVAARHAARVPRGDSVRVPDAGHGAGCAASEVLVPPVTAFLHRWF